MSLPKTLPKFELLAEFRNTAGSVMDWRTVQGYPIDPKYFNATIQPEVWSQTGTLESRALSGRRRSEIAGFDLVATMTYNHSFDSPDFFALSKLVPYNTKKVVWAGNPTANVTAANSFTFADAPTVTDYFNGLIVRITDGSNVYERNITAYSDARLLTFDGSPLTFPDTSVIEVLTAPTATIRFTFWPDSNGSFNYQCIIRNISPSVVVVAQNVRQPVSFEVVNRDPFREGIPDEILLS